jgi:hypothetical protein
VARAFQISLPFLTPALLSLLVPPRIIFNISSCLPRSFVFADLDGRSELALAGAPNVSYS